MNGRVYELLGLRPDQRALVSDLVNIRMKLIKGKTPRDATRPPTEAELKSYARQLRDELDAFTDDQPSLRHRILVGKCARHGIVSIVLGRGVVGRYPRRSRRYQEGRRFLVRNPRKTQSGSDTTNGSTLNETFDFTRGPRLTSSNPSRSSIGQPPRPSSMRAPSSLRH